MDLSALYQELILKHYRHSAHKGALEAPDAEIQMNNPTCGDVIVLQLKAEGERIAAVRFGGQGCAISQAAASMMAHQVEGKTFAEAEALAERFKQLLHGDADAARDRALGDLRALAGVAKFPQRVRCAMLAWNALDEAKKRL